MTATDKTFLCIYKPLSAECVDPRDSHISRNRYSLIESLEINPHIYNQLVFFVN